MSDKKSKSLPKEKFVTIYEAFFKVKNQCFFVHLGRILMELNEKRWRTLALNQLASGTSSF